MAFYTELDTSQNLIRLLHLSPASSDDDPITCSFTIASLDHDSKPIYVALSYAWGDVNDTRSVQVAEETLSITSNLHSALRHLRLEDRERTLWVDALCINQSDLKERMHQVSRMSSIYGWATQVVVWLGEGWDGSDIAIEFLRNLAENKSLHFDPLREPRICVNGLCFDSPELRRHLIRLFDLPWWKRTWTVQEFVLAQNLVFQCSRMSITRKMMRMARENYWVHNNGCCKMALLHHVHAADLFGLTVSEAFARPGRLDYIIKSRGDSYSVLYAIANFREREATNPRDRVYGMLGLGTGEYANLVEADYTRTPEQVCEAVVIKSVERTRTLEFLSHLFDHRKPGVPSFMPDWTGSFEWSDVQEIQCRRLLQLKSFQASRRMPTDFILISSEMATTSGIILDVIVSTSQPLLRYDLGAFDELHKIASVGAVTEEVYCHTTESRLVALWQSMCGGVELLQRDLDRYWRRVKNSTDLSMYTKWMAFLTASIEEQTELWDNDISCIYDCVNVATYGRRFFVTNEGFFGFGPAKCGLGDLVVVLAGGSVPYIIRSVPHSNMEEGELGSSRYYSFLGDSYVHGIMDGEALDMVDEGKRELEEIVLM